MQFNNSSREFSLPFHSCCLNDGERGNGIVSARPRAKIEREKNRKVPVNVALPAGSPTLIVFLQND